MKKTIKISGAGCCLVDQIYPDIDFSHTRVGRFMSHSKGDGGLHPGRLVLSIEKNRSIYLATTMNNSG